jgi:hypothetical protein
MTANELDAYGKIAHAMAIALFEFIDPRDLPPTNELELSPPYFYTYSMSNFEYAAEILWRLNIFRSLDKDNRFGVFFIFNCDLADVPVVATRSAEGGPSLERLIWAYFYLRSEYSRLHLDRSVLFFQDGAPILSIRKEERELFQSLERLGYVTANTMGYSSSSELEKLLAKMISETG